MEQNKIVLMGLAYMVSLSVSATDTHCLIQEQTIFSCLLGKKIVSVCASPDISPKSGYVQYRFGPKNAPEFIFPTDRMPAHNNDIRTGTLMFSGGGGSYMRFINNQYNYIVYTAIGKGWGTKDGVAVEKDGKLLKNLKCQDIPVSKLGEDFFSLAGLLGDQIEFLLP